MYRITCVCAMFSSGAICRDVIDDVCACFERGTGDRGFHSVNRNWNFNFGRQFFNDRNHAA